MSVESRRMTETPDFEEIARRIGRHHFGVGYIGRSDGEADIATALRNAWNARGAADAALIDQSLSTQMGAIAAGPYVKNLTRELKGLDR